MATIRKPDHQSDYQRLLKSHSVRTNQLFCFSSTSEVKDSFWPTCTRSSSTILRKSWKQQSWSLHPEVLNQDGLRSIELNKDQTQELCLTFTTSTWMNYCCQEVSFHQEQESDLMDHQSTRLPLTRPINISLRREFQPSELPTRNLLQEILNSISKRNPLSTSSKREKKDDHVHKSLFILSELFIPLLSASI